LMTIEILVVRIHHGKWKLWGSEAIGGLLAPAAKGKCLLGPNSW
jgi:hypothetical protein